MAQRLASSGRLTAWRHLLAILEPLNFKDFPNIIWRSNLSSAAPRDQARSANELLVRQAVVFSIGIIADSGSNVTTAPCYAFAQVQQIPPTMLAVQL